MLGNFPIQRSEFRGAPHTVEVILRAALESQNHFCVRQLAEEITKDLRTKDYLSEGLAIYHFICKRVRYTRDPRTIELVKAPYLYCKELLEGKRVCGDCDDITALMIALLLSIGAECRVVTVAFKNMFYKGERQYSHVFAQMKQRGGSWVTLDPVAGEKTLGMHRRIVASKIWPVG